MGPGLSLAVRVKGFIKADSGKGHEHDERLEEKIGRSGLGG